MAETHLDRAHAAMEAGGEAERMRFYEALAAVELFLLLEEAAEGDQVVPQAFEVEGQAFVLAFDTEARLAEFAGTEAEYVGVSGRSVAEMLSTEELGLALNLEVAPSAMLLPSAAMIWLRDTLSEAPLEVEMQPKEFHPPKGLPDTFLQALDSRLASAEGMAEAAYLVGVTYQNDARSHLLGFVNPAPGVEGALARAVSDVIRFSGLEAAVLDVGFFGAEEAAAQRMSLVGLRFDLPKVDLNAVPGQAPGMDPEKPPKLR